jgi:hypothetical protein
MFVVIEKQAYLNGFRAGVTVMTPMTVNYWPLGGSPLSPRSPLYGRGFWICSQDTRVFSRVYGGSPRGCCGFVVTAVTAMTLMTVLYGLILDRGCISTS